MKQLAFFMNPSRLSWKDISWLSYQIFNASHLIFTGYGISILIYIYTHTQIGANMNPLTFPWHKVEKQVTHTTQTIASNKEGGGPSQSKTTSLFLTKNRLCYSRLLSKSREYHISLVRVRFNATNIDFWGPSDPFIVHNQTSKSSSGIGQLSLPES